MAANYVIVIKIITCQYFFIVVDVLFLHKLKALSCKIKNFLGTVYASLLLTF